MFTVNEDMSIYVTRGDYALLKLTAQNDDGSKYIFKPGDIVEFKVTEKKACENVVLYKQFGVVNEGEVIEICLTEKDTKIGDVISKPVDYWYEVELGPNKKTLIGYEEDTGPKIFRLFPEGADVEDVKEEEEKEYDVDPELDVTSTKPVQNKAVAVEIHRINDKLENLVAEDGVEFRFGVNEKNEYGYIVTDKAGADTFIPFKRAFGNAEPWQVLAPVTFTNESGEEKTGTMPNFAGEIFGTDANSETYEDGTTPVRRLWARELVKTHSYTASDGKKYPLFRFKSHTRGYVDETTHFDVPIENAIAENIKSGVKLGGPYEPAIVGTFTADGTASGTDITNGKTAYVNGKKIVGTSTDRADYQAYKEAVIEGLLHSGIAVDENTTADALFEMLAERFPNMLVVYNNGKYTDSAKTGITGFTQQNLHYSGAPTGNNHGWAGGSNIENREKSIYAYWGTGQNGSVVSNAKIDVTEFKKIKIEAAITCAKDDYVMMGVLYKALAGEDTEAIEFVLNQDFDLDKIDGEYYIGVYGHTNSVIANLDITNITLTGYNAREQFDLSFGTAEKLVKNGDAYYMTLDTYGDNWKVSNETTPSTLVFDDAGINDLRVFYKNNYTFFKAMNMNKNYVFEFTAPYAGEYKLVANVVRGKTNGNATISVNGIEVKTINTYGAAEVKDVVVLGEVTLNAGVCTNKISINTSGKTEGTNGYTGFEGFTFIKKTADNGEGAS